MPATENEKPQEKSDIINGLKLLRIDPLNLPPYRGLEEQMSTFRIISLLEENDVVYSGSTVSNQ